jgi:hypothetical protein
VSYDLCKGCPQFSLINSIDYTRDGDIDGMSPEPSCRIYPRCDRKVKINYCPCCGEHLTTDDHNNLKCDKCNIMIADSQVTTTIQLSIIRRS